MNSTQTSESQLDEFLRVSNNPRQHESLRRIHKACDYLQSQDIRITPSSVERYCIDHEWEGPKAQSIRNSPVLLQYVKLRTSGQIIRGNKKASSPKPLIADETLRAYVRLLEEERDQAIAARIRVEKGASSITGISVDDLIRQGFGGTAMGQDDNSPELLPVLVKDALNRMFNEKILSDCGLKLHRDRIVNTLTGNSLWDLKHVEAVKAFVTKLKSSESSGFHRDVPGIS
ncbi:hypothetical protein [Pseudomonas sp. UM16]|uniref:hypothetical protein n=1 Tax=Pseudomonas sp. UM16 TaxID=3158962 RepID=UPI0039903280